MEVRSAESTPTPGWEAVHDSDGKIFYHHRLTGQSQWSPPDDDPPVCSSAVSTTDTVTKANDDEADENETAENEADNNETDDNETDEDDASDDSFTTIGTAELQNPAVVTAAAAGLRQSLNMSTRWQDISQDDITPWDSVSNDGSVSSTHAEPTDGSSTAVMLHSSAAPLLALGVACVSAAATVWEWLTWPLHAAVDWATSPAPVNAGNMAALRELEKRQLAARVAALSHPD